VYDDDDIKEKQYEKRQKRKTSMKKDAGFYGVGVLLFFLVYYL